MGKKFAQALLLSLAPRVWGGVGSASQVTLPDNNGIESPGGITDSNVVVRQETDGTNISNPITELDGDSFLAVEDSQGFVIESREYSSELSSREISNSKSHPFRTPEASSPFVLG